MENPSPAPRRFRFLRRLGWIAIWLFTFVAFAIAIENWRGRRAWSAFVAETEARGDRLDLESVVPPPCPPEENFAESPLFLPLFGPEPAAGEARKAQEQIKPAPSGKAPARVPWRSGRAMDLGPWQQYYRAQAGFPHPAEPGAPAEDVLLALSKFVPELEEVRAAGTRPRSRFPLDYPKTVSMPLPHLTVLRGLADIAQLRAIAELRAGRPEAAAADTRLVLRLSDALAEEPMLISLLVRALELEVAARPLSEGLARHAWTEEQLAGLAQQLAGVRVIDQLQASIRGERNIFTRPVIDMVQKDPSMLLLMQPNQSPSRWAVLPFKFVISGWYDQNRADLGRRFGEALSSLDGGTQRVDPVRVAGLDAKTVAAAKGFHPYSFLAGLVMPSYPVAMQGAASAQAIVQLARVALALERHRLRHGSYPETLAAVDPDFRLAWPADPASGEPPHYAPQPDGTFTLYYNGWNRTDDGGVTAWKPGQPEQQDLAQGDWVWPTPAPPETSGSR